MDSTVNAGRSTGSQGGASRLGPLGAELAFSAELRMVQETVRRYAAEVMRPIGARLDRMTSEQAAAPESPYWEARAKFLELGFGVGALLGIEPAGTTSLCPRVLASVIQTGSDRPPNALDQHLVRLGTKKAYEQVGLGPADVSLAEVHDATAIGEIIQS